jgi:hypothetical protein
MTTTTREQKQSSSSSLLHVSVTPIIQEAMKRALDLGINDDVNAASTTATLSLETVRRTVVSLQRRDSTKRVWRLRDVLRGAQLQVPLAAPPPRDPAFQAHLERLRSERDEREYRRIVGDVDLRSIVSADEETRASLRNTSTQLSLGMNMIVSAVTVFIAFFWIGRQSYGPNSHWPWILGLVGAIVILLVETVLFVVRASRIEYDSAKKRD